ncbi:hypothetical protein BDV33DRAFT_188810 [Aspergillus novoparasiticus]|uniref:Cyclase-domain-containing protein n=1 Tax=Aspergillus novoparasiticus TaxID=986946 RepID=A0A5N6F1X4_9EURO|nr:hypothetical protein BDV33DRAFT_188810 [Aspergillus novoparasiticus]
MSSPDFNNLPSFDELPPIRGMPQGCAWGVFDREGQKDYLGCLNLLTPSVVQAALKEGRDGESVSLNWPINAIHTPGFFRKDLERKVISFQDSPYKLHGFDDEISFNTQSSSHPAGSIITAHDRRPTADALSQLNTPFHKNCDLPTLDHWHARGALVGRGVLVDYCTYADAHGIKYNPFDAHQIMVEDLEAVIEWEQLDLRQGDILIPRSGFTRGIEKASTPDKQKELLDSHRTIGVEGTKKMAKWIWDHHFAAVAGDAIAFEQTPPIREDGTEGGISELVLHQYCLSLFGLNIGELWDLEELSRMCMRKKRYSFLLTSCSLNVPGSVGSPPNAMAIF